MRQSSGISRLVFLGCLIVAGYFAFSLAGGWIQGQRLEGQKEDALREVEMLRDQKARLEEVAAYVASDAYIEQEARRRLGYTRPGEIPFVVESPPLPTDGTEVGEWWQRLFSR
jgi:cell division protein DivIC